MTIIEKLRPGDEESRLLFPGIAAFAVALIGVGLGFVADWLSVRWLGIVAFAIVAVAVLTGFGFLIRRFITFPRDLTRSLKEFRERQQATWKRDNWKP